MRQNYKQQQSKTQCNEVKANKTQLDEIPKEQYSKLDYQYDLENDQIHQEEQNMKKQVIEGYKYQESYPYNHIGCLFVTLELYGKQYKKFYGTGTLIRDHFVLTCAHNLFMKCSQEFQAKDQKIKSVQFELGNKKVSTSNPNDCYIPQQFQSQTRAYKRKKYDYALIYFQQSLNLKTRIFLFENYDDISKKFKISGFSASETAEKYITKKRQVVQIQRLEKQTGIIIHNSKTDKGISGSPIFLPYLKSICAIVGIHIGVMKNGDKIGKYFNNEVSVHLKKASSIKKWDNIGNNFLKYQRLSMVVDDQIEFEIDEVKKMMNKNNYLSEYKLLYKLFQLYLFKGQDDILRMMKLPNTDQNYNKLNFLHITTYLQYKIDREMRKKFNLSFLSILRDGYYLLNCLRQFRVEQQYQKDFNKYINYWNYIYEKLNDQNITKQEKHNLMMDWCKIFSSSQKIIKILATDREIKQFLNTYCKISEEMSFYLRTNNYQFNFQILLFNKLKMFRLFQTIAGLSSTFDLRLRKTVQVLISFFNFVIHLQAVQYQYSNPLKNLLKYFDFTLQSRIREIAIKTSYYIKHFCKQAEQRQETSLLKEILEYTQPSYQQPADIQKLLKEQFPAFMSNIIYKIKTNQVMQLLQPNTKLKDQFNIQLLGKFLCLIFNNNF